MLTKATAEAARDLAPPTIVTVATFMGVGLQDWVLYLTIAYAGIRLLMLLPRILGCMHCFKVHKCCNLSCKGNNSTV